MVGSARQAPRCCQTALASACVIDEITLFIGKLPLRFLPPPNASLAPGTNQMMRLDSGTSVSVAVEIDQCVAGNVKVPQKLHTT